MLREWSNNLRKLIFKNQFNVTINSYKCMHSTFHYSSEVNRKIRKMHSLKIWITVAVLVDSNTMGWSEREEKNCLYTNNVMRLLLVEPLKSLTKLP